MEYTDVCHLVLYDETNSDLNLHARYHVVKRYARVCVRRGAAFQLRFGGIMIVCISTERNGVSKS